MRSRALQYRQKKLVPSFLSTKVVSVNGIENKRREQGVHKANRDVRNGHFNVARLRVSLRCSTGNVDVRATDS